jgi:hypothetical protein
MTGSPTAGDTHLYEPTMVPNPPLQVDSPTSMNSSQIMCDSIKLLLPPCPSCAHFDVGLEAHLCGLEPQGLSASDPKFVMGALRVSTSARYSAIFSNPVEWCHSENLIAHAHIKVALCNFL